MKLSVSMWSIEKAVRDNNVTQYEFIDWCNKQGVSNVELLSCYMKSDCPDRVNSYLVERNMQVSCYTILTNMVAPTFEE